ncbi:hypothetical protein [Anoxybacillus sp. MB8]|uniref:hypothetical protein n=1 Tax=Anoxybacillus sp. MB8 TaxID=2496850 RepID=UPI0013D045AB|nr:hypothetical protein [Anoxybacillus sp. MB8]
MGMVIVRYLAFPSVTNGISVFYEHDGDSRCAQPSKRYKHGWCHTEGEELDELALKVGFMTREQFAQERKRQGKTSWKNAYAEQLSIFVGQALEQEGIIWDVNGVRVLFICPRGEFIPWFTTKKEKNHTFDSNSFHSVEMTNRERFIEMKTYTFRRGLLVVLLGADDPSDLEKEEATEFAAHIAKKKGYFYLLEKEEYIRLYGQNYLAERCFFFGKSSNVPVTPEILKNIQKERKRW